MLFYNTYKNNRIILDAATSNTQVNGIVTNNDTREPENNVAITVQDQSYSTTTDAVGRYTLKIPVPGSYKIIFTKVGFAVNSESVEVTLGQTATLNMALNPA
ncbi:MAG TPA: carboxypeptidase-like regulatory domain-containing protein, partial [Chitinophagaceae bacterium]|nr:carboxypeptidase-like regulatory domain-containing protein [Chitinophagaceae bacterium]